MMSQNSRRSPSIALGILVFASGIVLGFIGVQLLQQPGGVGPDEAVGRGSEPSARLLYLSPSGGQAQLWSYDLEEDTHIRLTDLPGSISDYSPAPDGSGVALALEAADGNSLWRYDVASGTVERLLDCGDDLCGSPTWSANNVLAFSRDTLDDAAPAQIWLLDLAMAGTPERIDENAGRSPVWSPDGTRLAVVDDVASAIRILNVETGRVELVPSAMGVRGEWSPDGDALLILDLELSYEPLGRLYRVDFTAGNIVAINPDGYDEADFSVPAWSPTGGEIAVGLRRSGEGLGRKLLLLSPSGESLTVVAADLDVVYGGAVWSPDGELLAFQRYQLDAAAEGPAVMLWDEEDGMRLIREDAFLPGWQP